MHRRPDGARRSAFQVDTASPPRKHPPTVKKRLSHCRIRDEQKDGGERASNGEETQMTSIDRRQVLKSGAAFVGASAVGLPAISYGQTDTIKIGHLTPLTGFLGSLGAYAQLGIQMAAEEINAAGGVLGRRLDLTSEDSINPATAATKGSISPRTSAKRLGTGRPS